MTDDRLEAAVVQNCRALLNDFHPSSYLEVIGQRRAKGSGSSLGAPDAILYHRGQVRVIEFKRPHGGVLSKAQVLAIECRRRAGVDTYVVTCEQDFADLLCGRAEAWAS